MGTDATSQHHFDPLWCFGMTKKSLKMHPDQIFFGLFFIPNCFWFWLGFGSHLRAQPNKEGSSARGLLRGAGGEASHTGGVLYIPAAYEKAAWCMVRVHVVQLAHAPGPHPHPGRMESIRDPARSLAFTKRLPLPRPPLLAMAAPPPARVQHTPVPHTLKNDTFATR